MFADLAGKYADLRFTVLFVVLLLTISGHSFVGSILPVANVLEWLLGLSLIAVVMSVEHGLLRRFLLAAVGVMIAAILMQPFLAHAAPVIVSRLMFAVVCLLAAAVALARALSHGEVDREHIFSALDAYLLVGIAFGTAYLLLEETLPGSFHTGSLGLTPRRAIYFSFVTQSTLGYGDISPISPHAEGLAIAQGIGGQLYLVVLVARIVGQYSARAPR